MLHILIRLDSGPGAPEYRAICGYQSEVKREFIDPTLYSVSMATCETCKARVTNSPIASDRLILYTANVMEPNTVKIMNDLLSVFSPEQLQQIADMSKQLKERAEIRHCEQSLEISFNGKGKPRHFKGSDNVSAIEPSGYRPE